MVHTFELSKSISKDSYEKIISLLNMRWYKNIFATRDYAERGFQPIRLYKMKNEMFKSGQDAEDKYDDNENPLMYLYMISLSISTAKMFEGSADPHLSQNILNFTPDYVRAVYHKIFELIPF